MAHNRLKGWLGLMIWLILLVGVLSNTAHSETEQPIMSVENAWVRAVPPVAHGTAAYFTLTNNSDQAWELVSVSGDAAKYWMIHRTVVENGISKMQDPGPLWLMPGETLVFEPQALHIMVMGLHKPLKVGAVLGITLQLKNSQGKIVQLLNNFQVKTL